MTPSPVVVPDLSEVLIGYGYSPVGAELWARFVEHAAQILSQAERELKTPQAWAAFGQKRGALGVPKRKSGNTAVRRPLEDALTAELGHIARRLRAQLPLGHFLRVNEVAFATEHLIESETRTGRHSRKVDFFIYAQTGEEAPELAIEAKPIQAPGDIAGRYLAAEGLGCFLTEDSPYTRQSLAGMVAYTISDSATSHRPAIRAALLSGPDAALSVDDFQPLGGGQDLFCSRHPRTALSLSPIAVVHLEMWFAPEAADGPPSLA